MYMESPGVARSDPDTHHALTLAKCWSTSHDRPLREVVVRARRWGQDVLGYFYVNIMYPSYA